MKALVCGLAMVLVPLSARGQDSTISLICKDGTTSTTTGKGACSHHGGVDKTKSASNGAVTKTPAAPAPAPTAAPAPARAPAPAPTTKAPTTPPPSKMNSSTSGKSETMDPTGAIAKCKDGLYSHSKSHSGTCSNHGGVSQWLDSTKTPK